MSKVALNAAAKPEWTSATCKFVVDLTNTHMTKIVQAGLHITPQPSITCAECHEFNQAQAFDITALVASISDKRDVLQARKVRDIYLIDGSVLKTSGVSSPAAGDSGVLSPAAGDTDLSTPASAEAIIQLKVSVFYTAKDNGEDPDVIKMLIDSNGSAKPFHFYGLTAQYQNQGYNIRTMKSGYLIKPATGTKATELVRDYASIMLTKETSSIRTLETKWESSAETYVGQPAQETFCAHLADMAKPTGISALDAQPTLWQTNWVFPTLHAGTMVNEKGKLWLNVILEDLTGQVTVTMDEKTALSLSERVDKDTFLKAVSDGDPVFPTLLSVKMVRKLRTVSLEDTQQETIFVNNHIIEVSRQNPELVRTDTCLNLIGILRTSAAMSSAILPASLRMVISSKLYPLLVQYTALPLAAQPCKKVWVLIKATKKSICTD